MIPQDDPDLTAYLNELLRMNKPEQQDNTFSFPTPENLGKPEDHTPIQTRILKELNELKDKEKLNPQESIESRTKFLRPSDWTDKLPTEIEKQAIENILVEYHDIFARHRMDIGMNTEFKVKLTPKDDKAVYSQSLPWNHHSTAFFQVREPHICTKEAQRKITSPCGSTKNQQSDCR